MIEHSLLVFCSLCIATVTILVIYLALKSRDWSVPVQDAKLQYMQQMLDANTGRLKRAEVRMASLDAEYSKLRGALHTIEERLYGISESLAKIQLTCPAGAACRHGISQEGA